MKQLFITIFLGMIFGSTLIFADAFNWYRIQEMFYFESFHMYGLIGSAIFVGGISTWLLKKSKIKTIEKNEIRTTQKVLRPFGNTIGGIIFGAGWAFTGACTAPIFILVGFKWEIGLLALSGAIVGTILYGILSKKLPI